MRREHLIPLNKSKRVIYLDRRGKSSNKAWSILFNVLGILCLIYCLSIALFMGYGSNFYLIWAALGVVFWGGAWVLSHRKWMERLSARLKWSFVICVLLGCLFFTVIEGIVLSQFGAKAQPAADYIIVLGAQWKETGPSYVLEKRLNKAVEYLNANPDTKAIVSGGKGGNEPISEAQGMQGYLIEAGIAPERILMEDASANTCENLVFSAELLDEENDRVVLVTSNFHVFRATAIARRQGYEKVEGLSADSYPGMIPNNLFREFFGVVKDFCVGNM